MSSLVIPNTLVPRTPQDVSDVQENFEAVETWAAGGVGSDNMAANTLTDAQFAASAGMYTAYRTLLNVAATQVAATAAVDYFFGAGGVLQKETVDGNLPQGLYFDDADYTITGRTPKLRVRAQCYTNNTAPAITIAVNLYPISSVAGGPANVAQATLGAAVSGSVVSFASPGANTLSQGVSGDFTIPADGFYCLGVTFSGVSAANSAFGVNAELQLHWV